MSRAALVIAAVLALAGTAVPFANAAPRVDQLVVFRNGDAKSQAIGTKAIRTRAGDHRCRVPKATPLAALVRSQVADLKVLDFSRACDPSTLFVQRIGPNRNRGQSGWVYKVGTRWAPAGAADPTGPFGNGRLTRGARITWFYCVVRAGSCQRTLGLRARDEGGGTVHVRVTGYDDEGRGTRVAGATVESGSQSAETDANGMATLTLPPGLHRLHAEKRGHIRSFTETVSVG